ATCSPPGQATRYGPRDQRIIGLDCLIPVTQKVIGPPLSAIEPKTPPPVVTSPSTTREGPREQAPDGAPSKPSGTVAQVSAPSPPTPSDLVLGAFSEDPPWVVEPDELRWRPGLGAIRASTRAEVPRLVQRRRIPPGARVALVGA